MKPQNKCLVILTVFIVLVLTQNGVFGYSGRFFADQCSGIGALSGKSLCMRTCNDQNAECIPDQEQTFSTNPLKFTCKCDKCPDHPPITRSDPSALNVFCQESRGCHRTEYEEFESRDNGERRIGFLCGFNSRSKKPNNFNYCISCRI